MVRWSGWKSHWKSTLQTISPNNAEVNSILFYFLNTCVLIFVTCVLLLLSCFSPLPVDPHSLLSSKDPYLSDPPPLFHLFLPMLSLHHLSYLCCDFDWTGSLCIMIVSFLCHSSEVFPNGCLYMAQTCMCRRWVKTPQLQYLRSPLPCCPADRDIDPMTRENLANGLFSFHSSVWSFDFDLPLFE